jgi:CBS domain-containing protein
MSPTLVRNCMTAPAIVETPQASMNKLIAIMRLRRISAIPIVRDGELAGIVSTTDILRAPSTASASDIMSTEVVTAAGDDRLDDAARRFAAGRIHRVVAVDGRRITGILSPRDTIEVLRRRRVLDPIASVMTTPVDTIDIGDSIEDSVIRLANANVHGLVVTDSERPVGVFTHTEALAARRLPQSIWTRPVETVMSYETICIDSITPIYRAAAYVASMDVRRILVVDHRRLVGIVSVVDLVDVLARAPEPLS